MLSKVNHLITVRLEGQELKDYLFDLIQGHCLKKNEERWKFVYKKSIKWLKHLFFLKMKNTKKRLTETDFLKFYFEDLSKKKKIPLNYYQDPLVQKYRKRKSRVKDEKRPKSINIYYLTLVFECEDFVNDFFDYIDGQLMEHCMLEIPDKFQLIFRNYMKKSQDSGKVREYFESNKRCKLPWSFYDVKIAIKAMKFVWADIKKGIFSGK